MLVGVSFANNIWDSFMTVLVLLGRWNEFWLRLITRGCVLAVFSVKTKRLYSAVKLLVVMKTIS